MEYLGIWILFGCVAAVIANGKGRSGCGWFILGCLLGPISLIVAALPSTVTGIAPPTPETHVKCPDCREFVLRDAKVCKHCGCKLVPQ